MSGSGDTERERRFDLAESALREYLELQERGEAPPFSTWCGARAEFREELLELHAEWQRLRAVLEREGRLSERVDPARLGRLAERASHYSDYTVGATIARGGMGEIRVVRDAVLQRELAMKSLRDEGSAPPDQRLLARFLEEARITGQLDHPSIVPVHELGLDSEGRAYFTMKLVQGEALDAVFAKVSAGREGWTQPRALGVLLKVCEAMSYAHHKGVVHRDLKPANVMVGRYGEVFVMDWGLARELAGRESRDLRIAPREAAGEQSASGTRRSESGTPLLTMDGDVLGTPAFMPPEQALGRLDEIGPHSDVYAVGAMLYHLLAGHAPYARSDGPRSSLAVLLQVREGPPAPVSERAPETPVELISICEKAMARDWRARYRDMGELAEDLRAFLEHRAVRAHRTGAVVELRKWIERNRALASAIGGGILALAAGLVGTLRMKADAELRRDEVLRLSAFQELEDLTREADALWPVRPELLQLYDAWLRRARDLVAGLDPSPDGSDQGHRARLAELRAISFPPAEGDPRGSWRYATEQERWWDGQLQQLIRAIEAFADPQTGLMGAGISPEHSWGIERRREWATQVAERTLTGPDAAARWARACSSIASPAECPSYAGLRIEPQLGLLPIGLDPASGLWEFAHLQTGEPVERDADGRLIPDEHVGLVFVLIPGGKCWMGAQADDPAGRNHDPQAFVDEGPVHEVTLSPYFLSKYEMTQAQWLRCTGENPSTFGPHNYLRFFNASGLAVDLRHPVEQVSWDQCDELCRHMGLALPTEAQWEHAARAGTGTIWWSGSEPSALVRAGNLSDEWRRTHGGWPGLYESWNDGNSVHAPVGSYAANPFGLHDVIGNVNERCRDSYDASSYGRSPGLDPLDDRPGSEYRVYRGGGFRDAALLARSATRGFDTRESFDRDIGLRPAMELRRLGPAGPPPR